MLTQARGAASPEGPCGKSGSGATCSDQQCCSQFDNCGVTDAHCGAGTTGHTDATLLSHCFGHAGISFHQIHP